mmetsp:Transcript_155017/g.496891  ORF Transcript_155017/g.496891 Transcript_155017/m.496891 type:complete len:218 (+) Transcript_155017:743-1396(+)
MHWRCTLLVLCIDKSSSPGQLLCQPHLAAHLVAPLALRQHRHGRVALPVCSPHVPSGIDGGLGRSGILLFNGGDQRPAEFHGALPLVNKLPDAVAIGQRLRNQFAQRPNLRVGLSNIRTRIQKPPRQCEAPLLHGHHQSRTSTSIFRVDIHLRVEQHFQHIDGVVNDTPMHSSISCLWLLPVHGAGIRKSEHLHEIQVSNGLAKLCSARVVLSRRPW